MQPEVRSREASRDLGFTLLEMALAITLGVIIFATLGRVVLTSTDSLDEINMDSQVIAELKSGLELVGSDLRRSGESQITLDRSSADFDVMTVRVQSLSGGSPAYGAEDESGVFHAGWSLRYTVDSGDLVREIRDGSNSLVSRRIVCRHVDRLFSSEKGFEVTKSGPIYNVKLRVRRTLKGGNDWRRQVDSSFLARN